MRADSPRPFRVYKRHLDHVQYYGNFRNYDDAARAARAIGNGAYVAARKLVWHEDMSPKEELTSALTLSDS